MPARASGACRPPWRRPADARRESCCCRRTRGHRVPPRRPTTVSTAHLQLRARACTCHRARACVCDAHKHVYAHIRAFAACLPRYVCMDGWMAGMTEGGREGGREVLVRVFSTKFEQVFPGRELDTNMPSLGIDFCKVVRFDPIGPRADNLHAPGAMHQRSLRVTCARLRSSQSVTNLHRGGRLVVLIQKRCVNERVHLEQALPTRCHHLFRCQHFLLREDLDIGPLQVRRVKMFPAPTGRSAHGSSNTRAAAHTKVSGCPSLRSNISLAKEFQRTGVYGILRVVRQRRRVSTLSSAQLDPMHRLQRRQGKCCPCAGHQDGGGREPRAPPHPPEVARNEGSIEKNGGKVGGESEHRT